MKQVKRPVHILVLSDIHLGTYGCRAKELCTYLKSIQPSIVVLNGDIIDIWQFSKKYWPKNHMRVIKILLQWATKGIKIHYITGNHDEMLRKFVGFKMGSLKIMNKLILKLPCGKRAWFFHGDVFDVTMQHSKWLAKLGSVGYDFLIVINSACNFLSEKLFNKGKISFSKRIKNNVKSAVKFINNFESTAADIAISNNYDYVVCGHIHQPEIRSIRNQQREVMYLNSGDWIENLTSLEYQDGAWKIYKYEEDVFLNSIQIEDQEELNNSQLFDNLLEEFNLMKAI